MIGFIGSGLNPPFSLTREEEEFIESSKIIVVDSYTSPNFLKRFGNRELLFSDRQKLESFGWILKEKGNISIIIPGDPFSATTHFSIYMEAVKAGIKVKVFGNASIFPTAATRMGLHLYKVGPVVSLPRFKENFRPTSPYEKILDNRERGLHTVILLDTEPPMDLEEAIGELKWMESEMRKGLVSDESKLGVISALGGDEEKIVYGKIEDLVGWKEGKIPYTIIVPANLHFQEADALDLFRI